MSIGGVVINFAAKTATAVRDIGKVTRSLGDVDAKAKTANTKLGKLGGTMKLGVAGGAAAAAGGLFILADFMGDVARAAYDDNRAAEKLRQTLTKIPGVTTKMVDANEKWIDSMELATNIADDDLRVAVGKLARATGSLTEAQRLTSLAADVATGSNRSLSSVTDMLVKATNGNTSALKRAYPWLDKNKDGAVSLDEALDGLAGAYGGAAEAAASQDVWQTLKTIWGQIKEQLGQFILPLLDRFRNWFKDDKNKARIQSIIDKLGAMSYELGQKLVPALEDFLDYISSGKAKKDIELFVVRLQAIVGVIMNVWKWVVKAAKVVEGFINLLGKLPGGVGVLLGAANRGAAAPAAAGVGPATHAATTPAPTYVTPPAVIVTEEQVYQAVSRLLMRGQARHGRLVVVG